jgi:hypothetical protein
VPRPPPAQADENLEFTQDVLFRPADFKKKG